MGASWRSEYGYGLERFLTKIQDFDINDPVQFEKMMAFITEAPRGIQEPVWTRWQLMINIRNTAPIVAGRIRRIPRTRAGYVSIV